ncbi:hypothetical protein MMMDOFMJ_1895 [Methylobacterium gnaphalii]|nr:hypothetical protein MMMDOFMJ_1895 [Methylobacterium gnaphalii]
MRDAVIDRQLQHLGIDHDQAALFRLQPVEQAQDHGVDGHRLARAGGAGDEQVRHASEVGDDRLAADILAEAERQLVLRVDEILRGQQLTQVHSLAHRVRQFDADHVASGHDGDAGRDGGHRACDVVRQTDHAAGLCTGGRLEFVQGDDRTRAHREDVAAHAEILDGLLQVERVLLQFVRIDLLAVGEHRLGEQFEGWQLVILVADERHRHVPVGRHQGLAFRNDRARRRDGCRQGGDRLGSGLRLRRREFGRLDLGHSRLRRAQQDRTRRDRQRARRRGDLVRCGCERGGGFSARLGLDSWSDCGAGSHRRQHGAWRLQGRRGTAARQHAQRRLRGHRARGMSRLGRSVGWARHRHGLETDETVEHVGRCRRQRAQMRDVEGHGNKGLVRLNRRHWTRGLRLRQVRVPEFGRGRLGRSEPAL